MRPRWDYSQFLNITFMVSDFTLRHFLSLIVENNIIGKTTSCFYMLSSVLDDFHILILFCEISLCIFTPVSIMLMRNSENWIFSEIRHHCMSQICVETENSYWINNSSCFILKWPVIYNHLSGSRQCQLVLRASFVKQRTWVRVSYIMVQWLHDITLCADVMLQKFFTLPRTAGGSNIVSICKFHLQNSTFSSVFKWQNLLPKIFFVGHSFTK
jgi:hypothetical protein